MLFSKGGLSPVFLDATFRAEGISDVEKIGFAYRKNAVEICK